MGLKSTGAIKKRRRRLMEISVAGISRPHAADWRLYPAKRKATASKRQDVAQDLFLIMRPSGDATF